MSKICLKNLGFSYNLKLETEKSTFLTRKYRTRHALKNISLSFKPGDVVGLIGRNGSGKSTLLKILSGHLRPTLGELSVDGEILSLLDRNSGTMASATLYENSKLKAASLGLKGAEASVFVKNCIADSGLQERINEPLKNLSTGMSGRFNLALNTQIIKPISILDEWISTLDTQAVRHRGMLERLTQEADIVVLASHNRGLVQRICNRVVLLRDGEVVYSGSDIEYAYGLLEPIPKVTPEVKNINVRAKKQTLHYLCVSKTANCLVKELFSHLKPEAFEIKFHPETITLRDIPVGEKVFFLHRDPVERFARAFVVRKNKGAPMYKGGWSQYEDEIFRRYDSAQQLALSLSADTPEEMMTGFRDINRIFHVNRHLTDWLENIDYLEQRRGDIYFSSDAGDLAKLLSDLSCYIGIDRSLDMFDDLMIKFLTMDHASELSNQARVNIRQWYSQDIEVIRWLDSLKTKH